MHGTAQVSTLRPGIGVRLGRGYPPVTVNVDSGLLLHGRDLGYVHNRLQVHPVRVDGQTVVVVDAEVAQRVGVGTTG
ncbi:hypothetical protein GCM10029964_035410 [Kibdelosporangium lantanae]